jgi:hypothetical protein
MVKCCKCSGCWSRAGHRVIDAPCVACRSAIRLDCRGDLREGDELTFVCAHGTEIPQAGAWR